jgi:hypothetical protein
MVQKAVVVIASQPIFVCPPPWIWILLMYRVQFGMLKLTERRDELTDSDQLGVVTRAYFAQRSAYNHGSYQFSWHNRDFTQTQILDDFYASLESTLEGKVGEGAIYMGTIFCNRTCNAADRQEQVYGNSCINSDTRRSSLLKCSCSKRRSVPRLLSWELYWSSRLCSSDIQWRCFAPINTHLFP